MIWTALRAALLFILRLVLPPKRELVIPKIDPNLPCACCGATDGKLRSVWSSPVVAPPEKADEEPRIVRGDVKVEKTCNVCGAKTYFDPVLSKANDFIIPSGVVR